MGAKLKEIRVQLMKRRHRSVTEQGRWIRSVVQGYFNYFAVPGTSKKLGVFRTQVSRHWLHALRHRSHKARKLNWERMRQLLDTWMPRVRILHPYPSQRLRV